MCSNIDVAEDSGALDDSPEMPDQDVLTMLTELVNIWKANVMQSTSVTECLASAMNNSDYKPVHDLLNSIHADNGLDTDVLWAIFMLWALERSSKDNSIDRHSRRLLNVSLSGISKTDMDDVKSRFEQWVSV